LRAAETKFLVCGTRMGEPGSGPNLCTGVYWRISDLAEALRW
jgi:hypothetical protein